MSRDDMNGGYISGLERKSEKGRRSTIVKSRMTGNILIKYSEPTVMNMDNVVLIYFLLGLSLSPLREIVIEVSNGKFFLHDASSLRRYDGIYEGGRVTGEVGKNEGVLIMHFKRKKKRKKKNPRRRPSRRDGIHFR